MELMPAWKRWGYEEGIIKGKEEIIRKMLDKGFTPEKVADTVELPLEEILKLTK